MTVGFAVPLLLIVMMALAAVFILLLARRRFLSVLLLFTLAIGFFFLTAFWSYTRMQRPARLPSAPVVEGPYRYHRMLADEQAPTGELARRPPSFYSETRSGDRLTRSYNTPFGVRLETYEEVNNVVDREQAAIRDAAPVNPVALAEVGPDCDFSFAATADFSQSASQPATSQQVAASSYLIRPQDLPQQPTSDGPQQPPSTKDELADAPQWVRQRPVEIEDNLALVLRSDYFDNRIACDRQMKTMTLSAVREYAGQLADRRGWHHVDTSRVHLRQDQFEDVVHDKYYSLRDTSMGEMTRLYQLIVIDDKLHHDVQRQLEQSFVKRRVQIASVLSSGALAVVAGLFGVFRFAARKAPDPYQID